jgi:hypothetical protein
MFKATKRTLTAGAVIAAALAPSTAYARFDLNPPRAATASVQTQTSISPLVLAAESPTLRRDANLGPRENANPITAAAAIKKQAEQIAAAEAAPAGRAGQTSVTAFQWGDAGIGAAAMFLLLGAVGLFAIASRRWHHGATAS